MSDFKKWLKNPERRSFLRLDRLFTAANKTNKPNVNDSLSWVWSITRRNVLSVISSLPVLPLFSSIKNSVITSLFFSMFSNTSESSDRWQDKIKRVSSKPKKGEWLYSLLEGFWLNTNPIVCWLFQDMNYEIIWDNNILKAEEEYELPIYLVNIIWSFDATLKASWVINHKTQIHNYNLKYNPDYKITNISDVKVWQSLWIPQWGTWFYWESEEEAFMPQPNVIPKKRKIAAEIDKKDITTNWLTTPYPGIKDHIEILTDKLKDYCFVIDPWHWWGDPWAVPEVKNWNWKLVKVYEAPNVYDVSLRLLKYLRNNGAEVFLTHYSDQFWIQEKKDLQLFRWNIFNLSSKKVSSLDSKTLKLKKRRDIAWKILNNKKYSKGKKVVFLSLHADSAWSSRDLWINFSFDRKTELDWGLSKSFAYSMAYNTDPKKSLVKKQWLYVLRENIANLELLVELSNMANMKWAWRIRSPIWREMLAKKLSEWLIKTLS